jgi:predicted lipoprotein with Yx(FWY)xxD motif
VTKKLGLIGLATVALILAACNAGTGAGSATASASASASAAASASASASGGGGSLYQISVGQTSLGSVLTGPDGKTLYLFTKDSAGKSACTGDCATNWPPLTVPSGQSATAGEGVTGTLGTITRDDGSTQVTIADHPLYYYAPDKAAGDTNGQGKNDVWFAVTPTGEAVSAAGASPSASAAGASTNYGY